jgi:hypothetical protein
LQRQHQTRGTREVRLSFGPGGGVACGQIGGAGNGGAATLHSGAATCGTPAATPGCFGSSQEPMPPTSRNRTMCAARAGRAAG